MIPLLYVGRAMAKHDHNAELRIEIDIDRIQ
jgi:hypothetical protein